MARSARILVPIGPTLADAVSYFLAGNDPIDFCRSPRLTIESSPAQPEREFDLPLSDKEIDDRFH